MPKIVAVLSNNLNPSPMKRTSTQLELFKKYIFLLIFFSITFAGSRSYAQAKQRVYANAEAHNMFGLACVGCGVTNEGNAIDQNLNSYATINTTLAIGGYYQELIFPAGDLPGGARGAVVKLSAPSLLTVSLLGGVKLQAYNGNSKVGPEMSASDGLLSLLASGNQTEVFMPAPGQAYDRIRISIQGLLTALNAINVYHAYFLKDATNVNCDGAIDELHGISGTVAALGGVTDPSNAIDGNDNTFSVLTSGVGLAGFAQQTIIFPGLSLPGDSVRMVVSTGASLLSAGLLGSIEVQTFNGGQPGATLNNAGGLLNLRLLSPGSSLGILTFAPSAPFDRVQLRIGGTLSVLGSVNLHEVTRIMPVPTHININNAVSASGVACAGNSVMLSVTTPEAGATYTWYTQASGGTGTTGVNFTPTTLVSGVNNFYVTGRRAGCTNESTRKLVSVTVNNPILPVVSPVTPICSGSKATLQISAPVVGETYRWYDAAAGGTLVFTGETFLTPVLTANTSYYVASVIGACSSERKQVDVTVNPIPADAQVASVNVNITKGQTATLTAAAAAGSTVNWYTAPAGGSPLATGNSFTTPALTVNTTYYVGTQSDGGCLSANRIAVTVTVTDVDPGLPCNAANAQSNGVEGLLCVGCAVQNPTFAVDADPLNFSTIRLTLGVGGSVYQRLSFPAAGVSTDSIRLDLNIPEGVADISILGGATANVLMNGAVVKTYALNSTLLNLRILGGGRFKVTIPAGAAYNGIEIRLGSGVTALTTVNVYGAEVIYPNPTVAASGLNICSGSGTTLSATPAAGTDLKWYAAATGGAALATGNTYSPTGLTATTTYYIEVSKGGCANAERLPVKVNVNPAIVFATTTLPNTTLTSAYAKQITAATGGTPAFTYTLAPGSNLPAGLSLSAAGLISGTPTAAEGPYTFSILATDSKGCTAETPFSLTVTPALSLPAATLPTGTVGTIYPTQTLPAATGGTGPFTYVATNLPPGLEFDPATRQISKTPTLAGTYPVHVTVTDANGNTKTTDYTIVVRDPLALPAATLANGTVGITYPTQAIPAATGGIGPFVYSAPPASLPPGLIFNPTTREITGTPTLAGAYSIPVTVTDGDGKTVTSNYALVIGNPLVLPAATLADGNVNVAYASLPIPAATGGAGGYTYAATTSLPPGLNFDPATRIISGTPTQSGLYSVTITVTDQAGTKASNNYSLRVIGALNLPAMALADGTVGTVYTEQTLPGVTGGTGPYTYTSADLPQGLSFDINTRKLSGTPTQGGTFTFSVTAKDAANNSTTTNFTVNVKVDAPVVASTSICSGSTATLSVGNIVPGVTYNWYAATGSTPIFTGTAYTTGPLTVNTTYYVEAVSGTAVSSRTPVTVTVRPTPALAVVSAGQSISAGQTATLQAAAEAGNTISWFAAATGGPVLGTGNSYTTAALNTTTTFYVETANGTGCTSLTRVPVTVNVTTGPVNPNCNAATGQVSKIESLLCLLCAINNPSGSTDADPATFTNISLGVNVAGVAYQKLIFASGGAATDSIRIDMETPVGLADIGLLNGATITVYKGNTPVKVYPLNSSLLNLQLVNGNRFQATFPATGDFDAVEIRVGSVAGLLTNYNIYGATIIYPNPTVAATGRTICAGNTTTLSATANGGTTLKWYATATSGTALATGETFTTPALAATTTYYIEVSKAGCANAQRVPVTVTVTAAPTAPVVATVLPVCYGSTTSISVSNPGAGLSYNWYTVANGGTPIFTGATFVTPALTANTTYYVESANPGCGTSTRTVVPVPVNPMVTLPQIQASATAVASGQTVVLTATSPDADVTFNWYTSAMATTPVFTGATYVTEPLTANTTYYLEAKSNTTGCTSLSRVQVTITIDNSLPSPVPCEAAVSQTNGVDGVALLSAVFNPQLAIDNDTRTGSSLVMPVGLLGASVYQRLGFGSVSSPGDTVKVLLNAPGKLLSLGLLSSIQVGTYNGAANNNDAVSINNNLINLELLSNNSQALLTFVPAAPFDQVEVRLNSGLAGVLSTVDVNYARRILVAPTLLVPNPSVCATQTATLSVKNPNAAITYKWYNSALPGAVAVGTGSSFTTPALNSSTIYYVEGSTLSGCASAKTSVNVTVTPAPAVPSLVSANINTCPGSDVTLEVANPLTGITYKWYDNAGVYQVNKDGITFTITNVTASTSYSVEAVSTTCNVPSATKAIAQINISGLDVPVITPPSITVKSGSVAVLTATSSTAGVIFKWYDAPVNGNLLSSDARYEFTPAVNNGASPRIDTYYVSAEVPGGCAALTRAAAQVTVLPATSPTDVPCEAATVQVRDGVDGVAILTAVFNPERAVDNNAESASSLVMPIGVLGASVYQHVGFTGLSSIGDTVRIRISAPGKLLSLAVLPSIEVTTYQGTLSNNDMLVTSNPSVHLELLSGNSDGIISFVPAKQFDGVELRLRSGLAAALTTLDFNYAQRVLVAPKVSGANASACVGTAATLSVQNPVAGLTYTWYKGVTQVGTGTSISTETTLAAGTYDYFVTAARNGCASAKTKITVTILPAPDAPVEVAGNPKTICPNIAVTLAVTPVTGVSFNWFDAAAGGNRLATNTNSYTTAANLAPGIYNFYVEAANANSCVSTAARTKITLTVKRLSTPADIVVTGAGAPFCNGTKATLTATSTISGAKFTWFSDAALTAQVANTAVYEPVITGNTIFYVSVSGDDVCDGGPANAKVVTITVNPPALATDISVTGADAPLCKGSKALLTASSTTVVNPKFTWYTDAALLNPVSNNAVYEPVVTATTTYYVTVSGDNKCPNLPGSAKIVTVTVNTPATAADIAVTGNDAPFCQGTKAKLTASSATVINPIFIWYSDAALSTEVFRGAVYEPTLTASVTYYVSVSGDNSCPNDPGNGKAVALMVNNPGTQADINIAGNDAAVCKGTTVKLSASSTTVNTPVFTWYRDADLTDAVFTGPVFEPVLTATTTFYVTVRGTNRCESLSAGAKVVTVVINPPAVSTDITVAGNNAPFCAGTKALLTASSTISAPVFTWYRDAALTDAAFTGPVFEPVVTVTTTYYVTVSGTNRCPNLPGDAKIVTLIVNKPADASDLILSGADLPVCAGTNFKLTAASTTVTDPIFTWYTDAALTNATFTGAVFERAIPVTTTYYVTVKGANKCENLPGTGKAITVTVNQLPDVPIIGNAGTTVCSGDGTTLTIQNPQTGVTYGWYTAATNGTLVNTGITYAITTLNATTDYYVQATSTSGCGSPAGRVKVTVTVNTRPQAPSVALATVNTCLGSAAVLNVSNPANGVTYNWYATATSTVILGSGSSFTTPVTTTAIITYYVEASSGNCSSSSRTPVVVNAGAVPLPPPSVSGAANPFCPGNTTVLTVNNPDPALKYSWYSSATGTTALADGVTFNVPALNTTTIYYVGSSNISSGCTSSTRTAITLTVLTKLAAPVVSTQAVTATSITFAWIAVPGATAYEVSVDNGLTWTAPSSGAAGTSHLVAGLKPDQQVTIRVRARGQLDCQLSDATTFTGTSENPLGNEIFVPNTFTPNNDGKNDVLYVYGNTIAKMQLRVYNQWGQFLYESLNIQNGWDGTYKGQLQPNGVYVYYLEAEFNDGKKTTKKGTITLLR